MNESRKLDDVLDGYLAAVSERDATARQELISRCVCSEFVFATGTGRFVGHAGIQQGDRRRSRTAATRRSLDPVYPRRRTARRSQIRMAVRRYRAQRDTPTTTTPLRPTCGAWTSPGLERTAYCRKSPSSTKPVSPPIRCTRGEVDANLSVDTPSPTCGSAAWLKGRSTALITTLESRSIVAEGRPYRPVRAGPIRTTFGPSPGALSCETPRLTRSADGGCVLRDPRGSPAAALAAIRGPLLTRVWSLGSVRRRLAGRRAPRRSGSTLAPGHTCCGSRSAAGKASETRSAAIRVYAPRQRPASRRPSTTPTKRQASC